MGGAFLIVGMKVKLLKQHQGFKEGEVTEVNDARGRYWIMIGVAEQVKVSTKRARKPKEDKNAKPKQEDK